MLQQHLGFFQLIIIDYNMSADTLNVCRRYENIFLHRMKIFKTSSANVYDRLNEALSVAQGKYVIFIRAADILMANFLMTLYSSAERTQADVVHISNYFLAQEPIVDKTKIAVTVATDEVGWTSDANVVVNVLDMQSRFFGWLNGMFAPNIYNKFIRRDFLDENGILFTSNAFLPEWIFSFQCLCAAKNYIRIPDSLCIKVSSALSNSEGNSNFSYKVAVGYRILLDIMNKSDFFVNDVEKQNAVFQAYSEHKL